MKTKERIDQLFYNLGIWKQLPKYQAERRLDVFFGLYMEHILKECRSNLFEEEDQLILVPEFPLQKNKSNNECTNIDYLVFNVTKKCVHAIELKTDTQSVNDDQIDYYRRFKDETSLKDLYDFATKARTGRSKDKYGFLAEYISENHLDDCQTKGDVIYILPKNDFPNSFKIQENGFDTITFADIANKMEKYATDDELLSAFIQFLLKNNGDRNIQRT